MTTCHGSSRPFGPGYCLLLVHHDDSLSCSAAGGRKAFFPPPWASECPRGFFAFLCSTEHSPLPGGSFGPLCPVPAARAPQRWPSCPTCWGRNFLESQGWAPRVAPGACCLSYGALSTAPCQGSSGPFRPVSCLLLLHLQGSIMPWLSQALLPIASL